MKLSKLTTIIIVTINGKVLKKVIKNLSNFYKIIIVENNKDQQIKKEFSNKSKSIEVIVSKKNLGFAGGNNLALKKVKRLCKGFGFTDGTLKGSLTKGRRN